MTLKRGQWLGIDVGFSRGNLYPMCLIKSGGDGNVSVTFEKGIVRALGAAFPGVPYVAHEMLQMPLPVPWLLDIDALNPFVRNLAIAALANSALILSWLDALAQAETAGELVVCIDAPSGFAGAQGTRRETEANAVGSFNTPSFATFSARATAWAIAGNIVPLQQQVYWKLLGLCAYRQFYAWLTGAEFIAYASGVVIAPAATNRQRIREGFPAQTNARANGVVAVLSPTARSVLGCLTAVIPASAGNVVVGLDSTLNPGTLTGVRAHFAVVAAQLAALPAGGGPLATFQDANGNVGHYIDAFRLAFTACCESHGCAGFVGNDVNLMAQEGAILQPL